MERFDDFLMKISSFLFNHLLHEALFGIQNIQSKGKVHFINIWFTF